jgi:polysaccharide biosynthesis transport protein
MQEPMMANNQATQSAPALSIVERIASLRRRMLPMIYVFVSVLAIASLMAFFWPPSYKSTGTILIEQQELPTEMVRSTISSYADQRLQVIKQRVMTTENLFSIIQRYELYEKERRKKAREVVIDRMRGDIRFDLISADVMDPRSGHPTKATIAFSLSYSNENAGLAAKVANELVTLFLQENLDNRKKRAADATAFLDEEADKLSKHIDEVQKKISDFKEGHLNDLPELASINIQLLNRAEEEVRDIDTQLRSLDQQVVYLDAQLVQISPTSQVYTSTGERVLSPADRLKFLRTEYARVSGIYSTTHPDVLRLQREIAGLEVNIGDVDLANDIQRQLQTARTQLVTAQQRYAPDHPDVTRLNRLVTSLESQAQQAGTSPSVSRSKNATPDNPAYVQLSAQREASFNERASLQKKRADMHARIEELEKRLENTPGVERDYTAMVRELDNTQLKYRDTRLKQMEAQVAQNLETERKGERFTLIEPPLQPEQPASPNRKLIIMLGVVLAIAAAIGLALLLDSLDTTVRNKRDLEALLHVPPLVSLPWIDTTHDRALRVRRTIYGLAGAVGSLIIATALIHIFYRPLDVLWQVALRRLG